MTSDKANLVRRNGTCKKKVKKKKCRGLFHATVAADDALALTGDVMKTRHGCGKTNVNRWVFQALLNCQ